MTKQPLYKRVLDFAKEKQDEDYDSVFIIVGRERRGKSTLMLHMIEHLGKKSCKGVVSMDGKDFETHLYKSQHKDVVVMDEAGAVLFSRDAMKKTSKGLIKIFQQIGAKNLITIFCLPKVDYIDRYFREHRIDGLFNVFQRGYYNFFDRKQIENIIFKKHYVPVWVKKAHYFGKYKGCLKADYDQMKKDLIFSLGKKKDKPEIGKKDLIIALRSKGNTLKKIQEVVGCSSSYVSKVLYQPT